MSNIPVSKFKTPHNVMRKVLSDEEYKNFCIAWGDGSKLEDPNACFYAAECEMDEDVLAHAFTGADTTQGHEYWQEIYDRLVRGNK